MKYTILLVTTHEFHIIAFLKIAYTSPFKKNMLQKVL